MHFGWIPPEGRSVPVQKQHEIYIDDTPSVFEVFTSAGSRAPDAPRNWELTRGPEEFVRNGVFKNLTQLTGSCVGAGAGNMTVWATLLDSVVRGQRERITLPFWPYHYGRGRYHSGIRGPGEGSLGSGQAKALQLDGWLEYTFDDVPRPTIGENIQYTESVEMSWSDGARIDQKYITEGQKHKWTHVVKVTSVDEAAALSDSHYVFTIASNWGGKMQCPIVDGVLLNTRTGTWMHQMWVLDYFMHPRLGRLWCIGNNWRYVHGKDPGTFCKPIPDGCFYIKDNELAYILKQGDSFGFADPEGFVDRSKPVDWRVG